MFFCNIPPHSELSLLKNYLIDKYYSATCYYHTTITYKKKKKESYLESVEAISSETLQPKTTWQRGCRNFTQEKSTSYPAPQAKADFQFFFEVALLMMTSPLFLCFQCVLFYKCHANNSLRSAVCSLQSANVIHRCVFSVWLNISK